MIEVLLVDDHAMLRDGIKQTFEDSSHFRITGEAENGQQAIRQILEHHYDIVILDIEMPGRSGLDVLKQIKEIRPEVAIMVLSMYSEEQYALRAFKAGASGYLTKNSALRELKEAIRIIAGGSKYITPGVAQQMAGQLSNSTKTVKHERLSDRELEIMCQIASGKELREIADSLNISINTVATHRQRILKKMGMKNNVELTRYTIKEGLI